MEGENQGNLHKKTVHHVLAHSYAMYFVLFLVGVSLDLVFRFKIFADSFMVPVGLIFLIFGTILVLWAENASRHLKKDNMTKEAFCRGPYCYTRSPTHWGLFLLLLGFAVVVNAFFVILSTFISFFIAKFIFQDWEEKIMERKYGTHYAEYKKSVRL